MDLNQSTTNAQHHHILPKKAKFCKVSYTNSQNSQTWMWHNFTKSWLFYRYMSAGNAAHLKQKTQAGSHLQISTLWILHTTPYLIMQTSLRPILMKPEGNIPCGVLEEYKNHLSISDIEQGFRNDHSLRDPHLIAHPVCQWACNGSRVSAAPRWQGEIWLWRINAFIISQRRIPTWVSQHCETMAICTTGVMLWHFYVDYEDTLKSSAAIPCNWF